MQNLNKLFATVEFGDLRHFREGNVAHKSDGQSRENFRVDERI